MYCKNCGKQLSDEAIMCPDCGMPTGVKANAPAVNENENKNAHKSNAKAIALIGFVFACIAFFCTIVIGSAILDGGYLYLPDGLTVLPALAAIGMGIYALCSREGGAAKVFSIINVSISGFTIFYSFICIMAYI